MQRHFKIRFSIVIFLIAILGGASIAFLYSAYDTNKKMYEHPYRVSNELKSIRLSVNQLSRLIQQSNNIDYFHIGKQDEENKKRISIIQSQYLGDKAEVEYLSQSYQQWLEQLMNKEALEVEQKEQFNQLIATIQQLAIFADNKAAEFYHEAKSDTERYVLLISIALLLIILVSIYWLLGTLKKLREIAANRKQYSHIIDQNVMISAIDEKGHIFDVSHQLSRFLLKNKQELVTQHCKDVFFDNNDALFNEMWQQVTSGAVWQGEIEVTGLDSEAKWLGIDILPMQTKDYEYSGFRLLAHDISSKKSLEKVAVTDTLTGLLNRRPLEDILDREIKLAVRNHSSLTVVMLDIDFFKQYNDTYGHPAGDNVLSHVAAELSRMLGRPDDYVFRVGGEEFILLFNNDSAEESLLYLDRIRQAIEDLNIIHEGSTVATNVTVSMGAIFFKGEGVISGDLLIADADNNLYKAKEKRNCCELTMHGER